MEELDKIDKRVKSITNSFDKLIKEAKSFNSVMFSYNRTYQSLTELSLDLSEYQTEMAIKYAKEMVLFVEQGLSVREIAFELDLFDDDVKQLLKTLNLTVKTKSQIKLKRYREQLGYLAELGFTVNEIGEKLDKSPNTIKQYCRINGIKFNEESRPMLQVELDDLMNDIAEGDY
ncbi:MAG: hypothetical protein LBE23_04270 [Vagococcus sp.]|nr:hypothetical protein [Vagococcus sp.]